MSDSCDCLSCCGGVDGCGCVCGCVCGGVDGGDSDILIFECDF